MKHKKKEINALKKRYGVENLHFYFGQKVKEVDPTFTCDGNIFSSIATYYNEILICSTNNKIKKVYKNRKDIRVSHRLSLSELKYELERLSNDQYPFRFSSRILFEQLDQEFEDLRSLREAYLLSYLSGISL